MLWNWITILLSTASSKIVLNQNQELQLVKSYGVRQGDPLLPMLFTLVMDILDIIMQKVASDGILQPIVLRTIKFHCSIYTDAILFDSPMAQGA